MDRQKGAFSLRRRLDEDMHDDLAGPHPRQVPWVVPGAMGMLMGMSEDMIHGVCQRQMHLAGREDQAFVGTVLVPAVAEGDRLTVNFNHNMVEVVPDDDVAGYDVAIDVVHGDFDGYVELHIFSSCCGIAAFYLEHRLLSVYRTDKQKGAFLLRERPVNPIYS